MAEIVQLRGAAEVSAADRVARENQAKLLREMADKVESGEVESFIMATRQANGDLGFAGFCTALVGLGLASYAEHRLHRAMKVEA